MQGSDILAIRDKHGWSQGKLAEMLGMSRPTVNLMENDRAPIEKRTELAIRFLDFFGGADWE